MSFRRFHKQVKDHLIIEYRFDIKNFKILKNKLILSSNILK